MKKKRKQVSFMITIIIIVLVLLAIAIGFIFYSKDSEKTDINLSDSSLSEPGQDSNNRGTETPSPLNETENKTEVSGGGGGGASTEVTYGSGMLKLINSIQYSDYGSSVMALIHYTGFSENYVEREDMLYANSPFNPSGFKSKAISKVGSYELKTDKRPTTSLSTIYLELAMHSQSGDPITINSTNELRLSMPLASRGYTFSGKTITIQQYNPNNTAESYTLYYVRELISDNNGVITLANLSSTYNSEEPYAYFRLRFS